MTHENLELREWLAVNLMGYSVRRFEPYGYCLFQGEEPVHLGFHSGATVGTFIRFGGDSIPHYEATWEGMGLVVEAMRARGWRLLLDNCGDVWEAEFGRRDPVARNDPGPSYSMLHQHAPLAVAPAARAALEGGK